MTKISALSDIGTSVASNDVFVLVDVSNPTTPNKKVQQQNLLAAGGLLPDGSTATPGLRFLNDTDTGIYSSGSNTLGLVTGASTRLYIDSSGRVGLGTSSPGTGTSSFYDDLVVKNDGSGTGAGITIQSNSTNGFSGLDLRKTDGTELAKISASASTGKLSIDAGGSTAITVDSSRRVGIGTNSPGELLHLRAGSFSNTDLNSINNLIRITDLNSRYNGLETQIGNFKSGIRFDATQLNGATVYGSFIQQVVTSNNFTGGSTKMQTSLIFGTRGDAQSTASDAPVEHLRITDAGRVGIGTMSPSEALDVSGNVTISGSISKGSGSFKITHPLETKKDTHYLVHSFIEGPRADLIYRGTAKLTNGKAVINLDLESNMTAGTFEALCANVSCFTSNETDWTPVKGSVSKNKLTIVAQDTTSNATVSWLVIGERKDPHMLEANWTDENGRIIVEPEKEEV